MIARNSPPVARASVPRRCYGLAGLIAGHLVAAVFTARVISSLVGVQEFSYSAPPALGLAWGQATLLGQFLLLGTGRPLLRTSIVAGWFALIMHFGGPAVRATAVPNDFFGACFVAGVPLCCSMMIGMAARDRGCRILVQNGSAQVGKREVFQFSLRQLFKMTLCVAIALGLMRFVLEILGNSEWLILVFGIPPLANVLLWLPRLSLTAALGSRHPGWRSAAMLSLAIASTCPLLGFDMEMETLWMLVSPVIVQSLVVIASLLVARSVGYRFVVGRVVGFRPPNRLLYEFP